MTKIRGRGFRESSALRWLRPSASVVLLFSSVARPQSVSTTSPAQQQVAAKLQLHAPVERELAPGHVDVFAVGVERGQFAHVAAEQKGVSVVVTLEGPDGKVLVSDDNRMGPFSPEPVSWIAPESGVYQIQIRKSPISSETGHYQVELTGLRKPRKADRTRITAENDFFAAVAEEQAGDKDKSLEAIQGYERAAALWRGLKDGPEQALCFQKIGIVYYFLGERQKALDYYGQALPLHRAVGNRAGEANTLNNMGNAYFALGELPKMVDCYVQSLALQRAVGSRAGEAATLANIGRAYSALGANQKALDTYKQAQAIFQATGEHEKEAETLELFGNGYFRLNQMQDSIDYYQQALPLLRSVGDRAFEVYALKNMGVAYAALGEPEKALNSYDQALPLSHAVQDPLGENEFLVSLME